MAETAALFPDSPNCESARFRFHSWRMINARPFACSAGQQAERMLGELERIQILRRLHAVMADTPFTAAGVAEQACGREEKPAPAPHPERGVIAIDIAQDPLDLGAMRVETGEPVERGALVVHTAPAPFLL